MRCGGFAVVGSHATQQHCGKGVRTFEARADRISSYSLRMAACSLSDVCAFTIACSVPRRKLASDLRTRGTGREREKQRQGESSGGVQREGNTQGQGRTCAPAKHPQQASASRRARVQTYEHLDRRRHVLYGLAKRLDVDSHFLLERHAARVERGLGLFNQLVALAYGRRQASLPPFPVTGRSGEGGR
jgi:hypothetical protein